MSFSIYAKLLYSLLFSAAKRADLMATGSFIPEALNNAVGLDNIITYYSTSPFFSFVFDLAIIVALVGLLFREAAKRARFGEKLGGIIGSIFGLIIVMSMHAKGMKLMDLALGIWVIVAIMLGLFIFRLLHGNLRGLGKLQYLVSISLAFLLPLIATIIFLGFKGFGQTFGKALGDVLWIALIFAVVIFLIVFFRALASVGAGPSGVVRAVSADVADADKKIGKAGGRIDAALGRMAEGFKSLGKLLEAGRLWPLREDLSKVSKGISAETKALYKEDLNDLKTIRETLANFEGWVRESFSSVGANLVSLGDSVKGLAAEVNNIKSENEAVRKSLADYGKNVSEISKKIGKLDDESKRQIIAEVDSIVSQKIEPLQKTMAPLANSIEEVKKQIEALSKEGLKVDIENMQRIKEQFESRLALALKAVENIMSAGEEQLQSRIEEAQKAVAEIQALKDVSLEIVAELSSKVESIIIPQFEGLKKAVDYSRYETEKIINTQIKIRQDFEKLKADINSALTRMAAEAKKSEQGIMDIQAISETVREQREVLRGIISDSERLVKQLSTLVKKEVKKEKLLSKGKPAEDVENQLQELLETARRDVNLIKAEEGVVVKAIQQIQKAREDIKVHLDAAKGKEREKIEVVYSNLNNFSNFESQFEQYLESLDKKIISMITEYVQESSRKVGGETIAKNVLSELLSVIRKLKDSLKNLTIIYVELKRDVKIFGGPWFEPSAEPKEASA